MASLSAAFSPYTYVRTAVMRSLLFREESYHKMLKMSSSELAKFLQEAHYKNEISKLALHYRGIELIEKALYENLGQTMRKLVMISKEPLTSLIRHYAMKYDVADLKTIIRGKFTGSGSEEIIKALTFAGTLDNQHLRSLVSKNSLPEIIKGNGLFNPETLAKGLAESQNKKSVEPLEWQLDNEYYTNLFTLASSLEDKKNPLISFLYREVDIMNIMRLFRMKLQKVPLEKIKARILKTSAKLDRRMQKWIEADSVEVLIAEMQKSEYKDAVQKSMEKIRQGSLVDLQIQLYRNLYTHYVQFSHKKLLSVGTILSFMFAKDMELRNLRIMLKGKQLGLTNEFIKSQLVGE